MALKLDVLANTRQFVAEMKKAGASTEDISDALDQMRRDGDTAISNLERSFKDLAREAERTDKKVESVGASGFKKASDASSGFKDEAISNFSEVASSFNGDITQMADGVQGLTGGLASALTPGIGIPIAILGAAAGAFLQSWITSAEDSEQRIEDMYSAMTDAGTKFLNADYFNKALAGLDTSQIEEAQRRAAELGVEEADALRAMVGDREAIGRILASQQQDYNREVQALRDSGKSLEEQSIELDAINTKYGTQNDWLRDIQRDTSTASALWDALNGAMQKTPEEIAKAEGAVARFKQSVSGGVTIPVRADTSQLDAALLAAQRKAAQGIDVIVRPGQVIWD